MADLENVAFLALSDCLAVSAECPNLSADERRLLGRTLERLRDMVGLLTEVMEDGDGRTAGGSGVGPGRPAGRIRPGTG